MAAARTFEDLPASILRPLSVSEVAAIAGVERKVVNRMIDDRVLPKSCVRMRKPSKGAAAIRYLKPEACPIVHFNATTGVHLSSTVRGRVIRRISQLVTEGVGDTVETEGAMSIDLEQVILEAVSGMLRLASAEAEVSTDPDVRGGIPVLRGTRIGVYEIADLAEQAPVETLLADYPSLTAEQIDAARLYTRAHPRAGRPKASRKAPKKARKVSSSRIDLDTL